MRAYFKSNKENPISPNPRPSNRPSGGQNSRPGSRPGGPRPAGNTSRPGQTGTTGQSARPAGGANRPAGQSAGPGAPRTGGAPRPGGGPGRPGGPNRPRPQGGGGGGRHTRGRKHFSKSAPKEENSESEIEVEGTICAVLAGTMFKVRLANGHEVLAHISGKMRKRFIKIVVGDKVRMEMSPYDMTKARITFRIG